MSNHLLTASPEPIAPGRDASNSPATLTPASQVPTDTLDHRDFDDDPWWQAIPTWRNLSQGEFFDHRFQLRESVTTIEKLEELVAPLVDDSFLADVRAGLSKAPMAMRISPYLLSRINWDAPYPDPIRRQFIPVASSQLPDHPRLTLDSLHEQKDSPAPGLVHRYPDKALFLVLDVCPVYCRFCTRSYAIGGATDTVDKLDFKPSTARWEEAFEYLRATPAIEDVVISGGDAFMLPPRLLEVIGNTLLEIPHIRRMRFATKGPAVMPMKVLSDEAWTDALTGVVERGRTLGKEVCLHTHFNHTAEITAVTREAMQLLFSRGVTVRNQSVLIRGVNDDPAEQTALIKKLSYMNVQPYYTYQHDMVKHVEELRTRVGDTIELERQVRGSTAGFNTPLFIVDLPGGGGKRDVHSFDAYDEVSGISVYRSPRVDPDAAYLYFDPVDLLPREGRARWEDPQEHPQMIREALEAAGLSTAATRRALGAASVRAVR